jgi:acyl-CoA hydrolase
VDGQHEQTTARKAQWLHSEAECVEQVRKRLGNTLTLALPLGLGKPVALVDAFYQQACKHPELSLTVMTALTLERPQEDDPIRGRLLTPVFERLFRRYREPLYTTAERRGELPANVQVHEFYFKAGARLGNPIAQQNYVSSNYTHAARDISERGCNVVMQLLARHADGRLSMSCNPDTSNALLERLRAKAEPFVAIGVVHDELPFMVGDAEVSEQHFDYLLNNDSQQHGLFAVPRLQPVPAADYAIGLIASSLVKDGGTLQLGIGSMGDAIVQSLMLRDQRNDSYQQLLQQLGVNASLSDEVGGRLPFEHGLYGATEMFVEGFLSLFDSDILRREVYDFWALQQLVNEGRCQPDNLQADCLTAMADVGVRELRGKDFALLQYHGFFRDDCRYREGRLIAASGESCAANMANPSSQRFIAEHCLGRALRNGKVLHGGFFLGSEDFYARLRALPEERRQQLAMCGVDKINQLDLNPRLYRAQRRDARFINTGLNVSLNGAVASDTLETGQVISGVGGQYNFVAMAHQLQTGRSVLMIRSHRQGASGPESNIVPHYGACTIPRHLRDLIVTEYGVADLRGKSDREVAEALIAIADSRFQPELIRYAQQVGKLPADFVLPESQRRNTPQRIQTIITSAAEQGLCPPYPLGCDFSDVELRAAKRLLKVKKMSALQRCRTLLQSTPIDSASDELLALLALKQVSGLKQRLLRRLLLAVED